MKKFSVGFEMSYESVQNIVILRMYGFWNETMGQQFEQKFQAKIKAISAERNEWYLLIDFTRSPLQLPRTQEILKRAILFATQEGMKKKAILANGSIMELPSMTTSNDTELQVDVYFHSEVDAIQWLLNEEG